MPALDEIERLIATKEEAERQSDFAESITCTSEVIAEDRYKVVFSEVSNSA